MQPFIVGAGGLPHVIDEVRRVSMAHEGLVVGVQREVDVCELRPRVAAADELNRQRRDRRDGADVRYVGTACPRTEWSDPDRDWLESKGVQVRYRASLEDDLAAIDELFKKFWPHFFPSLNRFTSRQTQWYNSFFTALTSHRNN